LTFDQNNRYDACPESKDTKVLNMYNIFYVILTVHRR